MQPDQLVQWVLTVVVSNPEASAATVAAFAASAAHYKKTGRLPIGRLPWRHLRDSFRELGDRYFGRKRPRGVPGVVVDAAPDAVEDALRAAYFGSVDLYSFEYEDEAFNYTRYNDLRENPETGEQVAMELHARGFRTADGRTFIITHDEASRWEEQGVHWRESMLSWLRGREDMRDVLDERGFGYESVDSEVDADADIVPLLGE